MTFKNMKGYTEFINSDNEYCSVISNTITFGENLDLLGVLFTYDEIKEKD